VALPVRRARVDSGRRFRRQPHIRKLPYPKIIRPFAPVTTGVLIQPEPYGAFVWFAA